MWKAGELIRNKETGDPYLCVHVYRGICTLLFDIKRSDVILPLGILLPRDYDKFALDRDMEEIKKDLLGEAVVLQYKPLPQITEK
jgi:hypothetical protein